MQGQNVHEPSLPERQPHTCIDAASINLVSRCLAVHVHACTHGRSLRVWGSLVLGDILGISWPERTKHFSPERSSRGLENSRSATRASPYFGINHFSPLSRREGRTWKACNACDTSVCARVALAAYARFNSRPVEWRLSLRRPSRWRIMHCAARPVKAKLNAG